VKRATPSRDECSDGCQICQIQLCNVNFRIASHLANPLGDLFSNVGSANRQCDFRSCLRQGVGSLDSNSRRSAGNNRAFAGEIGSMDDLRRSRAKSKLRLDGGCGHSYWMPHDQQGAYVSEITDVEDCNY
jgi:hypothetical protein